MFFCPRGNLSDEQRGQKNLPTLHKKNIMALLQIAEPGQATTAHQLSVSYESEQIDEAREWIRKLQFMQKAKKEIDNLSAEIEDELMS